MTDESESLTIATFSLIAIGAGLGLVGILLLAAWVVT